MALQNKPPNNYPFSTKDGKVIPLDIIKAKGLIIQDVGVVDAAITIPVGSNVAIVTSTVDCIIFMGAIPGPLADGVFYPEAMYIHKNILYTISLEEGTIAIRAPAIGTVYIQIIEQWAGLALNVNFNTR